MTIVTEYQNILIDKKKESDFEFDFVDRLYYKSYKITLNCWCLCINCRKWLKDDKATRNHKNKNKKCFKYGLLAAMHHHKSLDHSERISNLKHFADL